MEQLQAIAGLSATLACGLFTGAAVYLSLVEHPARMACGTELAATGFPVSYRRASVMQASLAAIGVVAAAIAWLAGAGLWWLLGAGLLGLVIPYTLLVMMPTNKRLTDPALDRRSESTRRLLSRWGRLHAVRSGLSALALVLFLVLLTSP